MSGHRRRALRVVTTAALAIGLVAGGSAGTRDDRPPTIGVDAPDHAARRDSWPRVLALLAGLPAQRVR